MLGVQELRVLGLQTERRSKGLAYQFVARGATYVLCVMPVDDPTWIETAASYATAYRFHVLERPANREVLRLMVTTADGGNWNVAQGLHLEVFHLGPWLRRLLEIVEAEAVENRERSTWKSQKRETERAGKDFS